MELIVNFEHQPNRSRREAIIHTRACAASIDPRIDLRAEFRDRGWRSKRSARSVRPPSPRCGLPSVSTLSLAFFHSNPAPWTYPDTASVPREDHVLVVRGLSKRRSQITGHARPLDKGMISRCNIDVSRRQRSIAAFRFQNEIATYFQAHSRQSAAAFLLSCHPEANGIQAQPVSTTLAKRRLALRGYLSYRDITV